MLKEDVKFAKEQYKLAQANYSRIKQKWHDANKNLGELKQEKAKIEHQVNVAKQIVSSAVALVADAKLDFQRKQAHWKELNKQYQFLCNQNDKKGYKMITIDQLVESVDLDFEPRWVTKGKLGEIWLWANKPHINHDDTFWSNTIQENKQMGVCRLKLSEFDGKDWTECIYEVPRKTTGEIYKFDSNAIDTLYDSNPERFKKFICGEIVCKLNEVIDAVNELKGANNE